MILLKCSCIRKTGREGVHWINPAEDRDRYWTVVDMEMNFCVLLNAGNFLTF
jgi:hypothetical protein